MKTNKYIIFTSLLLISSLPLEVQAPTGIGSVNGLVNGLLHPLIGVDHLLVMLAIGLWASILDKTALWLLPTTFLIAMTFGALLSFNGLIFSAAENWVAFSVLVLGVLVWCNTYMSSALAITLVAVFAVSHGYVHGNELGNASNSLTYSLGFLFTTLLLHCLGVTVGLLKTVNLKIINACFGMVCAVVGISLLIGT